MKIWPTKDRLNRLAQNLAERHIEDFDHYTVVELYGGELSEEDLNTVYQLVVNSTVKADKLKKGKYD